MTAEDLKQYVGVIERMKSLMNSAEFDQVFSLLTSDLPKPKQFLLKMELKRMAQPCDYFIDLRGHVDGEVRPFVYRDKTHYMDDKAIQIFENGIKQYGGYTLGVFEEVMNADNNFRVMHKKETAQRVKSALQTSETGEENSSAASQREHGTAKLVTFGHYVNRAEERMNFGIDVDVKVNDSRFVATTSDLSISGCKLKIPKGRTATPGDIVTINFTGLEQEFTLDIPQGVQYALVDIEQLDKINYWRLKKLPAEQDQGFANFLQKFIHGNKRRYKVNLDNTTDAVTTKGYEQFYLPRLNSLPVYLAVNEGAVSPRFALTTDYNKAVWHYFLDEQQRSVLLTLLAVKRLKSLLAQRGPERSTILYCFTHAAKGKLYYYSATAEELQAAPELRDTFFGFGAAKPSWRVFHLNLIKTTAEHATEQFTLPAAQKADQGMAKATLMPLVQGVIKNLRYIASLTDISSGNTANYQQYSYNPAQLSQLNQFGHRKLPQIPPCEAIPVQYINLRAESRYLYKTTVQLRQNEQMVAGFSRDFSTGGLQIETVEPVRYKKGEIVQLDLVDLQKITTKHQLTQLPYEVMAVSKSQTIMNLRALPTEDGHTGKQFFQQLIQNNRAKLTLAEETPKYPGLSEALRTMYLKALNNFAFYLHRKGIRYELNVIAQGATPNALHTLLLQYSNKGPLDLELLLKNSTANLQFAQQLKAMKRFDPPKSYELYIKVPRATATSATAMESYYDYEFNDEQQKQAFIKNALRDATLFAFRLFLSRTGRPDTDYIAKEISYISVYAIHRAKTLEEELWSVAGVGDAVDISKELAWRYGCLDHVADDDQRLQQLKNNKSA